MLFIPLSFTLNLNILKFILYIHADTCPSRPNPDQSISITPTQCCLKGLWLFGQTTPDRDTSGYNNHMNTNGATVDGALT